jgi:imidazolonepropionase-like amidohydrolase
MHTLLWLAVVFDQVTVINGTGAPAVTGMRVVVEGERIVAVGKRVRAPQGARVIDGSGKYLIPGLWDMHVHMRGGAEAIPDNEAFLKLYLANGVTGVREMGGDLVETVLRWRGEIASGDRLGPRIATSGPKLDGPKPAWPGSIPVATPEEGRKAVQAVKALRADFVKLYFSRIERDTYEAILAEAKTQRLPVTGHLALDVSVWDASELGQHIEHAAHYLLPACSPQEDELRRQVQATGETDGPVAAAQFRTRTLDSFTPERAAALAARLAANHTWVTPTLAVSRTLRTMGTKDYATDPRRRYIYPRIWGSWNPESGRRRIPTEQVLRQAEEREKKFAELLALLRQAGVGLLAGSDTGASNNYVFPGWSLHEELGLLVEAGLTPLEALQTATRNAGRYLGLEAGTVEKGKSADLVLLEANPLEDIRNTQRIAGVMARGKWLDRAALDGLLAEVEAGAKVQ